MLQLLREYIKTIISEESWVPGRWMPPEASKDQLEQEVEDEYNTDGEYYTSDEENER